MENRIKTCTQCHKVYPASIEYFSVRTNTEDGLRCDCRTCESKRAKEYREKNKERLKERRESKK